MRNCSQVLLISYCARHSAFNPQRPATFFSEFTSAFGGIADIGGDRRYFAGTAPDVFQMSSLYSYTPTV